MSKTSKISWKGLVGGELEHFSITLLGEGEVLVTTATAERDGFYSGWARLSEKELQREKEGLAERAVWEAEHAGWEEVPLELCASECLEEWPHGCSVDGSLLDRVVELASEDASGGLLSWTDGAAAFETLSHAFKAVLAAIDGAIAERQEEGEEAR